MFGIIKRKKALMAVENEIQGIYTDIRQIKSAIEEESDEGKKCRLSEKVASLENKKDAYVNILMKLIHV